MGIEATVAWQGLLAKQHGLVSRAQALAAGVAERTIDRRLETGQWLEAAPSVYRLATATVTRQQALTAVVLWLGDGAVLSHRCAAALWGFARFPSGPVEVTVTRNTRPWGDVVVHRVKSLDVMDVGHLDGLPVTSAARTLLDLCGTASPRDLRASVDEALRKKWTTVAFLDHLVRHGARRHGIGVLRQALDELKGGVPPAESELESLALELLEEAGIDVRKQVRVVSSGQRRRLDLVIQDTMIVIECDGYVTHSSASDFEADRARNNALVADGYCVLHWTWKQLRTRRRQLLAELRRALSRHPPPLRDVECAYGPRHAA